MRLARPLSWQDTGLHLHAEADSLDFETGTRLGGGQNMGFIPARCPCCGGAIQLPEGTDRAVCPSCGMQVLTEAAVAFARVQVDGVVETRRADFQVEGGMLVSYHGASTDVEIPEGVRVIGDRCFAGMPISNVRIPEGVVAIGDEAFASCMFLEQAQIPSTVCQIGRDAFAGCVSLSAVAWPGYTLEGLQRSFNGTPVLRMAMVPVWRRQSRCQHCGGAFTGPVFRRRCSLCGMPRDY